MTTSHYPSGITVANRALGARSQGPDSLLQRLQLQPRLFSPVAELVAVRERPDDDVLFQRRYLSILLLERVVLLDL